MTTKTIKTVLFASILAAVLLTGTFATTVDAQQSKDLRNYDAEEIMRQLAPYIIQDEGKEKILTDIDIKERDRLQVALEKAQQDHRAKFDNPELKAQLLVAKEKFIESGIPFHVVGLMGDKLYIQLDTSQETNSLVSSQSISSNLNVPVMVEYGDGVKRGACSSTHDDCDPEQGGIEITIKKSSTTGNSCSLSMPMKKSGVSGFLTAGHCFTGYSETVYQPTTSNPSIGYSSSSWREYGNNLDCDCAWIKDISATPQQNGIWVYSGSYWVITGTSVPASGDQAMLRGQHNNNGIWYQSNSIDMTNVSISQGGIITTGTMGFPSPFQGGDSGGAVFYNGKYMGIAVAEANVSGVDHTFFIPWDHVNSSISGLGL